jgi:hypothetical protein
LKKQFLLLSKGLAWGLGAGLALSSLCLLLYRWVHADLAGDRLGYATVYFMAVGVLLGLLSGWLGGLNAVLWGILDPVMWKTAGLIPATAERIDAVWVGRLDSLMDRILSQTRGIIRFIIVRLFMPRIESGLDRFNSAVDRFRLARPGRVMTSQMMSYAALSQFVRPVWFFFYAAYGVVALAFMIFLGVPFIR